MKNLTSNQVRQLFLEFFKENGHKVESGASLIPQDDPTLLWINSGVATLKKYFDGSVIPDNRRIVNRSEEHTSELQSRGHLVCRLLLEKKKYKKINITYKKYINKEMICQR